MIVRVSVLKASKSTSRLPIPSRDEAPTASQPLLDGVGRQLGVIPNLFRLVGASPAALEGYLGLNGALAKTLDVRIALAVAQVNGCDYRLSAHSYLGADMGKLDAVELAAARHGRSSDAKADAAVRFAKIVAETRGHVSGGDLEAVEAAGYADAQVVEIVLLVALNFLTNLINNLADTDIDFPVVSAKAA
jgi:AhpD family alkylhydroperoxidase